MPIAHSVFKQTVGNVSAHQLQQHTIKNCCKMIQLRYQRTREANHSVPSTKRSLFRNFISQLWRVSLRVLQHSTSHTLIHMVHFLQLLHQNCSLVTGSLRKLYFLVQLVVIFKS